MIKKCEHCGNTHEFRCPLIKSIEYYENGTVKRIEYMTPTDYVNTVPVYQPVVTVPVYQYPIHRPISSAYCYGAAWGSHSQYLNTLS